MPHSHDDPSAVGGTPAPTAADFDEVFSAAASPGIRRVWELAVPKLPPQIEPFSFVSPDLLAHVAQALDLRPGQRLVDLGCGRGGPGLWLAQQADVTLVGVDFSPVAIAAATQRAKLFGLAGRASFAVGDLTSSGLATASADAVVSVDAFHFAADPATAAAEARRLLRPGGRLALTNWQPKVPGDPQLPARMRIDWPQVLHGAGFAAIQTTAQPQWQEVFARIYQVALDLGDPGSDDTLASLQDEARHQLPLAGHVRRIVMTATAPGQPPAPIGSRNNPAE